MLNSRRAFTIFIFSLLLIPSQGWTATYNIIDIGTLGGDSSSAYGVMYDQGTDSLNVVGASSTSGSDMMHSFLYTYDMNDNQKIISNISPTLNNPSIAFNISTNGLITGLVGNDSASNPFDSASNRLLVSSVGGSSSVINADAQGFGINSSGRVVGQLNLGNTQHAFSAAIVNGNWVLTDIGRGGTSYAQAINDAGIIVGQETFSGILQAAVWTSGGYAENLAALVGGQAYTSIAKGINSGNTIVGYYTDENGIQHSVWWEQSSTGEWVMSNVPIAAGASSHAFSINDAGLIVGEYSVNGETHAYIYDTKSGILSDLYSLVTTPNNPFISLESAAYITSQIIPGIDNAIVGVGITADGQEHAFLAYDPVVIGAPAATVPEPTTLLLMGAGLAGMRLARGRFRRTRV